MKVQNYHARIVVRNKTITEFEHDGKFYVEGREGSAFELELENNTNEEVLMVPSVDGLSIIDGSLASNDSKGYILSPRQVLRIPGWSLNNNTVAKFVFSGKKKSYASNHVDHADTSNVGVIGVLVWSKKEQPKPYVINKNYYNWGNPNKTYGPFDIWSNSGYSFTDTLYKNNGLVESSNTSKASGILRSAALGQSSVPGVTCSYTSNSISSQSLDSNTSTDTSEEMFSLGTGFGKEAEFKTTTGAFEKDKVVAMLALYYDNKKGLEARGIQVRKPKAVLNQNPNPFPGQGCRPPLGWK